MSTNNNNNDGNNPSPWIFISWGGLCGIIGGVLGGILLSIYPLMIVNVFMEESRGLYKFVRAIFATALFFLFTIGFLLVYSFAINSTIAVTLGVFAAVALIFWIVCMIFKAYLELAYENKKWK